MGKIMDIQNQHLILQYPRHNGKCQVHPKLHLWQDICHIESRSEQTKKRIMKSFGVNKTQAENICDLILLNTFCGSVEANRNYAKTMDIKIVPFPLLQVCSRTLEEYFKINKEFSKIPMIKYFYEDIVNAQKEYHETRALNTVIEYQIKFRRSLMRGDNILFRRTSSYQPFKYITTKGEN